MSKERHPPHLRSRTLERRTYIVYLRDTVDAAQRERIQVALGMFHCVYAVEAADVTDLAHRPLPYEQAGATISPSSVALLVHVLEIGDAHDFDYIPWVSLLLSMDGAFSITGDPHHLWRMHGRLSESDVGMTPCKKKNDHWLRKWTCVREDDHPGRCCPSLADHESQEQRDG